MTPGPSAEWWRSAVVYQIYPRSFADSNGDGIGDVDGIRARLPYLAELGVDAIWISPWYPSPLLDGGYDVADYRRINPDFGTLADADAMIAEAHALGLRVLIDLVPNHCSWEHPWFKAAVAAGRGSPERGLFWFREGAYTAIFPDEGEPRVGKFIELWKQDNGNWLMYRQMWNRNAPLQREAPPGGAPADEPA